MTFDVNNPVVQVVDSGTARISAGQTSITVNFKVTSKTGDTLSVSKKDKGSNQLPFLDFSTPAAAKISIPLVGAVDDNFYWQLLREV